MKTPTFPSSHYIMTSVVITHIYFDEVSPKWDFSHVRRAYNVVFL